MNPTNNNGSLLGNLANGFMPTNTSGSCSTPVVVVSQPQSNASVEKVFSPPTTNAINVSDLANQITSDIEFNFTNNTGAAQTVYFSSIFGQQGQATDNFGTPAAVDFPAFHGDPLLVGGSQESGGSALANYIQTLISNGPQVISKVTVQTTDATQRNVKLQVIVSQTNNTAPLVKSMLPGVCDTCANNNNSNLFTVTFNGPFGVGGPTSLGYTVNNGISVTVRLSVAGTVVNNFVATPVTNC